MVASKNGFQSVPSSPVFWRSFREMVLALLWMFDRILLWSHPVLGFCFGGEIFDHSFKFSACNWVVHNFYFFLFSLGKLNFSKNLPISFRLSILLACIAYSRSLMILCISALSVVTSPLSFLILLIWVFSFFFLDMHSLFLIFLSWFFWTLEVDRCTNYKEE